MNCKARKKNGCRCEQTPMYGVLCRIHAKQISNSPSGFISRRVKRIHLKDCSEEEVELSMRLYREDKGEDVLRTSNALTYRIDVIEFLLDGEKTASQIVEQLNKVSRYSLSSSKVGQLMRVMMNEGTVVRRQANIDGSWGSIYALKSSVHEQDPPRHL